ncbi:MAG: hypothetical protein JXB29_09860 [Sedimentisphaerales bacterium]|nr:hypothetical protein [Sedimentisphaerales bacterium]
MTSFLFSAPISCGGEKEEKLPRNNYVAYLTKNDTPLEIAEEVFLTSLQGLQSRPC